MCEPRNLPFRRSGKLFAGRRISYLPALAVKCGVLFFKSPQSLPPRRQAAPRSPFRLLSIDRPPGTARNATRRANFSHHGPKAFTAEDAERSVYISVVPASAVSVGAYPCVCPNPGRRSGLPLRCSATLAETPSRGFFFSYTLVRGSLFLCDLCALCGEFFSC